MSQIQVTKLKNNLTIGSDLMQDVESVSFYMLAKTGSRNESEEINGISHFLEHMAFKGTKKRTYKEIAEEFDRIGGRFNAYTSKEVTAYYAKVLKDDLEKAIDIITDIVQHSIFDQSEIDKEKGVILQEMAQTEDTPDDIITDYFKEAAFPNQAFGRTILGKKEVVNEMTRDKLVNYIENKYTYNNVFVSASGNFDQQSLIGMVEEKVQNLSSGTVGDFEKALYVGGEKKVERDIEQVQLMLGFKGVSMYEDDLYTYKLLSIILGGGMSSRLFQEIREKRGLVYTVSAFHSSYLDTGIFGIHAGTDSKHVNEVIEVAASEMRKLIKDIKQDELESAKTRIRASLLMSKESTGYRADKLANNLAVFGRNITSEEVLEKISRVQLADISNLTSKLLQNQNLTVAMLGKISQTHSYNTIVNLFSK